MFGALYMYISGAPLSIFVPIDRSGFINRSPDWLSVFITLIPKKECIAIWNHLYQSFYLFINNTTCQWVYYQRIVRGCRLCKLGINFTYKYRNHLFLTYSFFTWLSLTLYLNFHVKNHLSLNFFMKNISLVELSWIKSWPQNPTADLMLTER